MAAVARAVVAADDPGEARGVAGHAQRRERASLRDHRDRLGVRDRVARLGAALDGAALSACRSAADGLAGADGREGRGHDHVSDRRRPVV